MAGAEGRCGWWFDGAVLWHINICIYSALKVTIVRTYPTHDDAAPLALGHHIARTTAHAPARQLAALMEMHIRFPQPLLQSTAHILFLELAMQRLTDQLVSVLEQVGAKLAARPRQAVQGVQIELAGELADNAMRMEAWSACTFAARICVPAARIWLTDNSSGRLKIH